MQRFLILAVAGLILAFGCSSGQAAQPAPSPTPTPIKALAQEYLQMVAPANDSGSNLTATLSQPGANQANTKPLFEAYLADLTTLNTKLVSFQARMPAAAQADVQQLRQDTALQISGVQAILAATSATDWQAAVLRSVADARNFGGAAQLIRADLGLPPAQQLQPSPTPSK